MIGEQVLNYKIKSLIGEGGMGSVYLGEHTSIDRKVAIKVLRGELVKRNEVHERFKNEASVMARLQHPGIVALHDYFENEEGLFLIMEYVEGKELSEVVRNLTKPLSIDRGTTMMTHLLEAFSYAHKNGVVHRDVKPSNVLVVGEDTTKVLDFGIAKLVGDEQFNLTKTGTQVGTVYYMSPEQVNAQKVDHRSDIYSLGVVFYEMLVGYSPYRSLTSEFEIYEHIVRKPLIPLTEFMGEEYAHVWGVIQKATDKEVSERFQSCDDFLTALKDKEFTAASISKATKQQKETSNTAPKAEKKAEAQRDPPNVKPKTKSKIGLYIILAAIVAIVGIVVVINLNSTNDSRANGGDPNNNSNISQTMQPINSNRVVSIMKSYYASLEGEGQNFNADAFYAPLVNNFISKKNVTPQDINAIHYGKNDFFDPKSIIQTSTVTNAGNSGGISYWQFWVDFRCFRTNRRAVQTCRILVEVGFNENHKIVSYKEVNVTNLHFGYGRYMKASSRRLNYSDIASMNKMQLRVMRNEIYARYGYTFQSNDLRTYFNNQPWYEPRFANVNKFLTQLEKDNINLIKSYE